jgi:hypothetical protein
MSPYCLLTDSKTHIFNKLRVAQLVRNLPLIYGTTMFITV